MTLESIHEDILTAIDNKNPSVKAESVSFLARCFTKCTPTILNKKYLKIFTTALIKTLNESGKFFSCTTLSQKFPPAFLILCQNV